LAVLSQPVARSALLVALTFVTYLPSLGGGFLWDDETYVVDNEALRSGGGLISIWTDTSATPQYYPLTHTTFWLEYRIWGLDPFGFRLGNLALHAAVAVLFYLLLRRLSIPGAWLAAAIFAVHPLHVESVAWITERKNVLSGAFYLGSLICWVRFFALDSADRGDPPDADESFGATRWAVLALTLYVAALLSKTVATSLPLTLAILLWWRGRRIGARHLLYLGPMLLGGALMGTLTSWLETHQVGAAGAEWALGPAGRGVVAGRAWWFYLWKLALPVDQSFVYPRWEIEPVSPLGLVWPATVVATLVGLFLARRRIGRGPLAAFACYTVALSPALGFFDVYPMRYSYVADHFAYLASLGPIALVGALAAAATVYRRHRVAAVVVSVVVVALLVGVSRARGRAFHSLESLWNDTIAKNPTAWMAHNNLGILEAQRGRTAEAMAHFRRVVELKSDHASARSNLGLLLLESGRPAEALPVLESALVHGSEDVNLHVNLGDARAALGDASGAEEAWVRALALAPGNLHAHDRLGVLRLQQDRPVEAERHFRALLSSLPGELTVRHNLGAALARQGRLDDALEQYEACLAMDPKDADAHYNAGTILARTGRLEDGVRHLAEAVRLDPGSEEARRNLAMARGLLERRGNAGRDRR
jgi:Flp pilus assembly protein TadD